MINESIETLNKRLIEYYGVEWNNDPIWRIVYSEDQYEKQLCEYNVYGIKLLFPEVREIPKYKQWLHNVYILEQLVIVPEVSKNTLLEKKISYEPLWVFEDKLHNPLPPKWEVCQYVIDTLNAAKGKNSMFAKYVDPDNGSIEMKEERLKTLHNELFGNETDTSDALAHGQAIVVPNNYEKVN